MEEIQDCYGKVRSSTLSLIELQGPKAIAKKRRRRKEKNKMCGLERNGWF
jgi:hypothetical protein